MDSERIIKHDRFYINSAAFLLHLFTFDVSLKGIIQEQYELAKKGISLKESDELTEFEREAYISFVIEDKRREVELYTKSLGLGGASTPQI